MVQLHRDQFGHLYWLDLDVLSRTVLKREKRIDGVVTLFQEFDLFGDIGVIAVLGCGNGRFLELIRECCRLLHDRRLGFH